MKSIKGDVCNLKNCEYGNMEQVHKSKMCPLTDEFASKEFYLSQAYFALKPLETEEKLFKEMQEIFKDGGVEMKFEIVKKFKDGFILEVFDLIENENIFDELVAKNLAVRIKEDELSEILDKRENSEAAHQNLEVKEEKLSEKSSKDQEKSSNLIRGKITALTSPNDFYLSSLDALESFKQLHIDIQCFAPGNSFV